MPRCLPGFRPLRVLIALTALHGAGCSGTGPEPRGANAPVAPPGAAPAALPGTEGAVTSSDAGADAPSAAGKAPSGGIVFVKDDLDGALARARTEKKAL